MSENKKHAGNISLLGGRACLDFVNTLDWRGAEQPVEYLNTYHDLVSWCRHAGVISNKEARILVQQSEGRKTEENRVLRKAVLLRETIYRIFFSLSDGKGVPNKDLADFNTYLSEAMADSRIVWMEGGGRWDVKGEKTKPDWILNPVIRSAADVLVSDDPKRVKKCGDQACGWLFYDTSRNKSRRWCDMRDCGNRAKANRFYKKKTVKCKGVPKK